jgi:hypothetical protein
LRAAFFLPPRLAAALAALRRARFFGDYSDYIESAFNCRGPRDLLSGSGVPSSSPRRARFALQRQPVVA